MLVFGVPGSFTPMNHTSAVLPPQSFDVFFVVVVINDAYLNRDCVLDSRTSSLLQF